MSTWLWRLEICIPKSQGTITIREAVLDRVPPPGQYTCQKLKHPIFLRRGPICLPRGVGLMSRLLVWHIPRGLQRFSKGTGPMDAGLVLSLCLTPACLYPQGQVYTLVWHLDFCVCCQGTPFHHLTLKASRTHIYASHKTNQQTKSFQIAATLRAHQEAIDQELSSLQENTYKLIAIATA